MGEPLPFPHAVSQEKELKSKLSQHIGRPVASDLHLLLAWWEGALSASSGGGEAVPGDVGYELVFPK